MEKPDKPRIIELPRIYDPRGSLTFTENGDGRIPFDIQRAYWIYDVPAGETRGGHSHKLLHQFLIAVNGSFNVNVYDGTEWTHWMLNMPCKGLYIPPGCWRTLDSFASRSVCMALASLPYDEDEYIRDYDEYLRSLS